MRIAAFLLIFAGSVGVALSFVWPLLYPAESHWTEEQAEAHAKAGTHFHRIALGGTAHARTQYRKYFDQKYFPKDGDTAMKKAYEMSSCNFCHIGGATDADRKNRNAYGQALAKLLKKEDSENLTFKVKNQNPELYQKTEEKVIKALETVENERSEPNNKNSPTFGELLKSGKLPKSPATTSGN